MEKSKEKNRADMKWGHPGLVMYLLENGDAMFRGLEEKTPEELEALREPFREPSRQIFEETCDPREKELAVWTEHYTEHGCPKEPEASNVRMLVRSPKDVKEGEKLPAIFFIPGGGIAGAGTPECSMSLVSNIMLFSEVRGIAVSPEYRIAPLHKYPAAINDCQAAFMWMVENADKLHIDTDKIVISGGSSGGHLALSVTFRLKDYNYHGVSPRGVLPLIPVMDDVRLNDSNRISFKMEDGSIAGWDINTASKNFKMWLGDRFGDPTLPPEAVPNRATAEDVKGYPPVWFTSSAELDVSRDSVYAFAALLHQADIFCDVHIWGGCAHPLTSGTNETSFVSRIWSVISGAFADAVTYDFRRKWLNEDKN